MLPPLRESPWGTLQVVGPAWMDPRSLQCHLSWVLTSKPSPAQRCSRFTAEGFLHGSVV